MPDMSKEPRLGPSAMTALAVGGMVGGGIYVALGVVVEAAGRWAWASFVIAGVMAIASAYNYGTLSNHFEAGGGAFEFLEEIDRRGMAGSLSWVLLGAYTLTIALYAFAFGEYVAHAVGIGATFVRLLSIAILVVLAGLNLAGAGKLTSVEIVIVTANVVILVILGIAGLGEWEPARLVPASGPEGLWAIGLGAAAIFVAYEGFQLITYEYEDLKVPRRTLTPVLVWSAVAVVAIYVGVTVGATMILGADRAIEGKTVALALAAEQRFGTPGLVAMTVAAAFATSAAINSTLFSTAQLARRVAGDGELPAWLDHENGHGIPDRPVLAVAGVAGLLAVIGSLSGLVEAASFAFLVAFGAVALVAWQEQAGLRWVAGLALTLALVIGGFLVYRLATLRPVPLAVMTLFFLVCFAGRPWLLRRVATE